MSENFRKLSRGDWNGENTLDSINAGSLQRIADATEKMAASYDEMRVNRDYWKNRAENWQRRAYELERSNRSLRGVITRRKRGSASNG